MEEKIRGESQLLKELSNPLRKGKCTQLGKQLVPAECFWKIDLILRRFYLLCAKLMLNILNIFYILTACIKNSQEDRFILAA